MSRQQMQINVGGSCCHSCISYTIHTSPACVDEVLSVWSMQAG
jgi:hypothetical protein